MHDFLHIENDMIYILPKEHLFLYLHPPNAYGLISHLRYAKLFPKVDIFLIYNE